MSNYIYGSSLSWSDYLQTQSFVDDISFASHDAGRRVSMEISRQTREVIASNEALARENIRMMEASTDRITSGLADIDSTLNAGFDRLSYDLQDISSGISELNSTFHWGFSQLIASIGHMNDTLSELVKIAKTPVQTVAFNHFEIARDAFRKGLLQESLEELDKSIKGDHTSPGYKLEWRFHNLVGVIRLGDIEHYERALIDLTKAEESFLLAARYAKTDYPEDAARAFLSAGWAAYCQGKMKEALTYTEQALALHPKLSEALFQAAKVRMALGEVDKALPVLGKAIDLDRFYALKAAGDGDFKKHDDRLRDFLEAMRMEKYQSLAGKAKFAFNEASPWLSRELPNDQTISCVAFLRAFLQNKSISLLDLIESTKDILAKIRGLEDLNQQWVTTKSKLPSLHRRISALKNEVAFWIENSTSAKTDSTLQKIDSFLNNGLVWPLLDLINFVNKSDSILGEITKNAEAAIIIVSSLVPGATFTEQEKYQERETYQEEVEIKPGGLFRKPVTEMQTKTRIVTKSRIVERRIDALRDDIYDSSGKLITSIYFSKIPAGHFMMGDKGSQHQVSITKDFYLGKYPTTQAQWQVVIGSNPSHFKGDPNLPVEQVSWNDCQQFLNKLNEMIGEKLYRLPTEMEWEYACRAGSIGDYCFGDGATQLREYGWFWANSDSKTQPIGKLKPNAWGMYEMHGNVWEWQENWSDEKEKKYHAVRGGSWNDSTDNLRCAACIRLDPCSRNSHLGFRVVRAVTPEP